jgi:hypothetical protein
MKKFVIFVLFCIFSFTANADAALNSMSASEHVNAAKQLLKPIRTESAEYEDVNRAIAHLEKAKASGLKSDDFMLFLAETYIARASFGISTARSAYLEERKKHAQMKHDYQRVRSLLKPLIKRTPLTKER